MRLLTDMDRFSALTGLIYSAALEPERWQDVLDHLHQETGGAKTHVFGYDFDLGMDLGFCAAGYDEAYLASYAEHYCHINPWAHGWISGTAGVTTHVEEMCPRDTLIKTEFYADWVKPQEDVITGGGILVAKSEHRMFALGGNIRARDGEKLEADWLRLLEHIKPHLSQAFEISRALTGKSLAEEAMAQEAGILLLGRAGDILYASRMARQAIKDGHVLREDHQGRLRFAAAEDDMIFRAALSRLASKVSLAPNTFVAGARLPPQTADHRLLCRIAPFHHRAARDPGLGLLLRSDEPCLLLTLTARSAEEVVAQRLGALYGMTSAEAYVACALADGLSGNQIAARRGVSVFTVRNQRKAAMWKCGARRQIDLIRTVDAARLQMRDRDSLH